MGRALDMNRKKIIAFFSMLQLVSVGSETYVGGVLSFAAVISAIYLILCLNLNFYIIWNAYP